MIVPLRPNRVRRTYLGGARIDALTGFTPDGADGQPRPEDWMASTTTAYNGTAEIPGEGLGRLADGRLVKDVVGTLPILVKLLDAGERLTVQAHPTVPYARAKMHSPVGKTECWYFLPGTAPDACVYLGFREGITEARWRAAFAAQQGLLECLHRVPVRAGDFVFVDGGVPHAIGAGAFMIELQEPSDLMVVAERFTPSGRAVPPGKLHGGLGFDEMFHVYTYEGLSYETLCARYVRRQMGSGTGATRILGPELTDKFQLWRLAGDCAVALKRPGAVAVVTDGAGTLNGLPVTRGDRLVLFREPQAVLTGPATVVIAS